jgi:hypothetical protein
MPATSAMGHVWTAPWQELFDVTAALVRCGHVSGLFVRRIYVQPRWSVLHDRFHVRIIGRGPLRFIIGRHREPFHLCPLNRPARIPAIGRIKVG